jgi:hypothetical protein
VSTAGGAAREVTSMTPEIINRLKAILVGQSWPQRHPAWKATSVVLAILTDKLRNLDPTGATPSCGIRIVCALRLSRTETNGQTVAALPNTGGRPLLAAGPICWSRSKPMSSRVVVGLKRIPGLAEMALKMAGCGWAH